MEPWVMQVIWLAIFIGTLALELITSDIDCIWFTASSVVCLIVSVFYNVWWVQVIIFVVLSVLLLICTRPMTKKMMDREIIHTNSDKLVGAFATVVTEFSDDNVGEVKVDGQVWRCVNRDQLPFEKGEKVIVEGINGNKLVIKKITSNDQIVNL